MSYRTVFFEQNCHWLFVDISFLEVCMHLIANFTCKDTAFERVSSSCYRIFLNWPYRRYQRHQEVFSRYWRNLYENIHSETQLRIIRCNLATMPAGMKTKKCIGKLCIWRPGHSYICPLHVHFIFAGVRKFSDFFDFGLHCSLRVSLILLYFISSRAWVENLHIKNCIKDLMVVMPSYFYKDNKYKTSWRRPF